nr:hypothetical protein [Tanacetum cinerariifolium]
MTDYALWEVIVNGNSTLPKRNVDGVEQTYPPTTTEEKLARKNELKARETLSMDDLYSNMKIYKTKRKGLSSSNQNSQNVAIMSYNSSGSTNQAHGSNSANIDSLSDFVIYSFFANQSKSPHLDNEDLQHIDADDLKEMDLKWECMALRENKNREPVRRNVTMDTIDAKALVAQDGLGYDWSDQNKDEPINFALIAYTSLELRNKLEKAEKAKDEIKITLEKFENSSKTINKMLDSQVIDKYKTCVGYHAVPPPYIGNFKPLKPNLILADVDKYVVSESVTSVPAVATNKAKTSESKPKSISEPFIED